MKYWILIACLAWGSMGMAQEPVENKPDENEVNSSTQFLIENLVQESEGESFDFDTQFEYLEAYRQDPLDLNKATEQELVAFGLFSAIQIQALLLYREKYGQIFSLYELQGVPTFDQSTIVRLTPYVSVAPAKEKEAMNFKKMFQYSRHQIFVRYQRLLEEQKGFSELEPGQTGSRFLGSPDKLYARYRLSYKDRLSLGVTMEKDAGEEFFTGSNPQGFDYYSAHLYLKNLTKNIHSVALGDFQVFFGQGLTIWGGFGIRKGAQVLDIKRLSLPLRAYTSVNESLFLRGGAAHFEFLQEKNLEVTVFGSYRRRDANLGAEVDSILGDLNLDVPVSSLQDIGFHRTPNEIQDENSIGKFTTGGRVAYKGSFWHVAGNFVYNQLSNELRREDPALYQQFDFAGRESFNTSLDYSVRYKNVQFFGETAINERGGVATINSILADLDPRVSLGVLHRHYDKEYYTLNGNAFGESTRVGNESGLYLGMQTRLGKGVELNTYFDIFEFPWLSYRADAPTRGYEIFSKLEYSPNYYISAYTQYRFERKGRNISGNTTNIDQIVNNDRHNLRFHFAYDVSRQFAIRTRLEFSFFQTNEFSKGMMIYQDLVFKPKKLPLKAQIRLAFFDTDNFDTRIYAYENDVLYAFSVLPYFGRGLRYYFNTSYKINRHISLWLRFSQTYFADRTEISSGLNEIEGRTRSEVKVQLRLKF